MVEKLKNKSGSFSAVSKPNFASKYSLGSPRRDLQNALLFIVFGIKHSKFEKPGKTTLEKVKIRGA